MKRYISMGVVRRAAVAGVALLLVPGTLWAEWHSDPWITTKTKIALATTENVSAMDVNVDTVDGRVTLHGKVPTAAEKEKAGQVAAGIDGVGDVRNLLQVVSEARVDAVEVKDDAIAEAVTKALAANEVTKGSNIEVESVNAGVVLLGGNASSLLQHLEAIRIADATDGVRRVATEVQTPDRLYDERLWDDPSRDIVTSSKNAVDDVSDAAASTGNAVKEASEMVANGTKDAAIATKDAAVSAGEAVRDGAVAAGEKTGDIASDAAGVVKDAWITSAVKTRLLASSEVPALAVNVDTDDGVVKLFGIVPSAEAKAAAAREARAVGGVSDVDNQLEIAAGHPPVQGESSDDEVAAEVKRAIAERAMFADSHIRVTADEGIVRLQGRVSEQSLVLAAATVARSVDGVRSVDNDLQVGEPVRIPRELTR